MLSNTIQGHWERLTDSERKVARAILSDYPSSALDSLSNIAMRAEVSAATVTRFITKIGLAGYPEFRNLLRGEIQAHMQSPAEKAQALSEVRGGSAGSETLVHVVEQIVQNLRDSLDSVSPEAFDRAAREVATTRQDVYVAGGRLTAPVAAHLVNLLRLLRPGVKQLDTSYALAIEHLIDAQPGDVLIVFDVRRYQQSTLQLADRAKRAGLTIILVTDEWVSPITAYADAAIALRMRLQAPWDALSVPMAFAEALVNTVAQRLGAKAQQRLKEMEAFSGAWLGSPIPTHPTRRKTDGGS